MLYRCSICGTPVEEYFGYCSLSCKQVYEHERREDILNSLPWEIVVAAYRFRDMGYPLLYSILLETV